MAILNVPATLENIAVVNQFIEEHLPSEYQELQKKIQLVAEELLVNVFMHAYSGTINTAEIGCKKVFWDNNEYFCFWVKDTGKPFNPFLDVNSPDIHLSVEQRPEGGLGIHLIKSMVTHFAYSYTDKKNHIELYFAK